MFDVVVSMPWKTIYLKRRRNLKDENLDRESRRELKLSIILLYYIRPTHVYVCEI